MSAKIILKEFLLLVTVLELIYCKFLRWIKEIWISKHWFLFFRAFALSPEFMAEMRSVKIDAYFISGVYCLKELRNLKAANDGNILSITDENCHKLSPLYNDFSYLKDNQVAVYIYAGTNESDKFKEHSKMFSESSIKNFVKEIKFLEVDHFDIIEKLVSEDYEITRSIIDNLKN